MDPEATAKERFRHFGSIEGVEESSGNSSLAGVLSQLSPTNLEYYQTAGMMKDLLLGIRNNDDTTKIDNAVEKGRSTLLASDLMTSPLFIATLFTLFGQILIAAFQQTGKIEYLNEAISIRRQAVETSLSPALRFAGLYLLSSSLLARFALFPGYRTQDPDEALEILSEYVSCAHASLLDRFHCACMWAVLARYIRHSSVSTAYETALSMKQDTVLFSPTLQLQHATLATDDITQTLSLDYASYRINQQQLEETIEVLERGRALLWSEMRHLRTSIDRLLNADPVLGHKFAAVN